MESQDILEESIDRILPGRIYSISIGHDPKNSMGFKVGQTVKTGRDSGRIEEIVRDEINFYYFGNVRYVIYIKMNDGDIKVWKTYENVPISVTYKI